MLDATERLRDILDTHEPAAAALSLEVSRLRDGNRAIREQLDASLTALLAAKDQHEAEMRY